MSLRDYQQRAIDELRHSFKTRNKRVMLSLPTGSGKTHIAVSIIKSILERKQRVMFAVDRLQLLEQTKAVFESHGLHSGIIQGDRPVTMWADLQIASIQTLNRRSHVAKPHWLIIDEAHTIHKPLIERLQNEWSDVRVIGLTATPFTKGLGRYYDDLIVVESAKNLIETGHLCDYDVYAAPIDMKGVKSRLGDFVTSEAEKRVNTSVIVGDVVSTWLRLAQGRKTVAFAVSVAHSKSICDEFMANGVPAAHIDAYTEPEDRERILSDHASGRIKILVNVGITVAGWDSPDTTCLIFATPTRSLIKHIQILGRVLRVSSCNTDALILDHGGNIERNGFPTDQLPDYLDDGEGRNSEANVKDKKDPDPIACKRCRYVSTSYICPQCGYEPERVPNVEAVEGRLKKLEKASVEEKREFYCMALGWVKARGFKPGMAYHLAKEKFGVFPTSTKTARPIKPDDKFYRWMTHRNIKHAKTPKRPPTDPRSGAYHTEKRSGYEYTLQHTRSGERIRVNDVAGKFICWAGLDYKDILI